MSDADQDLPGRPELTGRIVLVTGAARGQGRAIAERLVDAGASVIAGDVLDAVDELADELGERVHAGHLDVTDAASWEQFVAAGVARFGGVDSLVNNAGILRRVPIERERADELERVWRVNTLGPFLGMQAVLPHLRARGGGTIVNTTSTASLGTHPGFGAYSASKAALRSLTKVAALELAGEGIRVNAVVPGPVLTPMVLNDDDPIAAERLAATPLGRAGLPADIAELVLFLVSDRSSFMTGAELVIDGGQTLGTALRAR
jgi:NAD(P)-dependent dehydrogenase (short-subunit alcohol dehydrogenase family)